ncbi:MAG: elongation factor P [Patescibacteria group bacterium]|nr:elongation factor P [Patescibacteria group bacterium]MDD4303986.1 elongation factor P [Patescibacteria group bacterium]MDD4695025.1 elongation factor P [Patescibacteria group bacterium]
MLEFNELKLNKIISFKDQPYKIISAQHSKQARSGAVLKTKLKNLITGDMLEKTFSGGDKAEEANLTREKASFLYKDNENCYFMDQETFEQFFFDIESMKEQVDYLKDGTIVEILKFNDKPVSVSLPTKMEFKVISAPPGVKGDTAGSATKQVTIETGANIKCPLFIKDGDIIKINTETGEYVERA